MAGAQRKRAHRQRVPVELALFCPAFLPAGKGPVLVQSALMQDAAVQLFFQGNRHLGERDHVRAEACFRQAVAIEPMLGEAHANLGWLLDEADAPDEAEACYRRALALNPSHVSIHLNYGALLGRLKRFDDALPIVWRAIELEPESAAGWSNLGVLLSQMALHGDAETCCRRSLALQPDYAKAHINLAYLCLRRGELAEGWAHYAWRGWQCHLSDRVDAPRWAGEPLSGRSVLVGLEAGYGDMIQFCRFATSLKALGARRVTLLCPPPLADLFATLEGVDAVLSSADPLPATGWDCWTSAMSVPQHLNTSVATIPADLPYLHPQQPAVARWNALLPTEGLRIGLVWKGNPDFENDAERSLPSLALLTPLAEVPGTCFISLQKGQGEDEAAHAPAALNLLNLGAGLHSFADTAALIECLDLVICVDTAVAHLAGALGKPCWVMLPHHMTDWRWLAERDDTPWYPGVLRLFRQPARGDWAPVIAQIQRALGLWAVAPRSLLPRLPASSLSAVPIA